MSEELKPQAQNNAEATTNAQAKPAAEVSAAAKPAPAKPVAKPAAPAKPAVNELKPKVVAPAELHAEMKRLHDEEGYGLAPEPRRVWTGWTMAWAWFTKWNQPLPVSRLA